MEEAAGTPIEVLRVDGGAVKNQFLMQFQSDVLQLQVELAKLNESTALGAAYLAGWRQASGQTKRLYLHYG